jgi:hypothetical protein
MTLYFLLLFTCVLSILQPLLSVISLTSDRILYQTSLSHIVTTCHMRRMEPAAARVALVTGANKGIGLEIARQLGMVFALPLSDPYSLFLLSVVCYLGVVLHLQVPVASVFREQ